MACELYCCLLPRCEALRICRSGFPIRTVAIATFAIIVNPALGEVEKYIFCNKSSIFQNYTI